MIPGNHHWVQASNWILLFWSRPSELCHSACSWSTSLPTYLTHISWVYLLGCYIRQCQITLFLDVPMHHFPMEVVFVSISLCNIKVRKDTCSNWAILDIRNHFGYWTRTLSLLSLYCSAKLPEMFTKTMHM